ELRGRVLDAHEAPAAGAHVALHAAESFGATSLVSGEDGTFTAFAAPGRYTIEANWRSGLGDPDDPRQAIELRADGPTLVTLRLPARPNHRAHGRVVDQDGDPIADVAVVAGSEAEVLTDA